MQHKQTLASGFTLIEMLITIAIIAVVVGLAAPAMKEFYDKNRLKISVEEVYGLLARAKAEAVTRDTDISVTMNAGAWCMGYATAAGCDCTVTNPAGAGACAVPVAGVNVLQVVDGADFNGVTLAENFAGTTTFDSVNGGAGNGSLNLVSGNWALNVLISNRGRIRVCAPTGKTLGYTAC